MPHAYPLLLDLTDRLVVIIGGGKVAARKAAGVISAGGRVRCIAPRFDPDLPQLVERISEEYSQRHLNGAALVFAATDRPAVNDAVVRDCRRLGILVCRADGQDRAAGDFITPAKLEEGAVIIAVSAGGSPALAAAIRDQIGRSLDPRLIRMSEAMQTLRPILRDDAGLPRARRAQVLRELAGEEAIDTLDREGIEGLRAWLRRRFPELGNV